MSDFINGLRQFYKFRKNLLIYVVILTMTILLTGCADASMNSPVKSPEENKIIMIDPGHGGQDAGMTFTVNNKEIYEKDLNL